MPLSPEEFFKSLREEKLKHKEHRMSLVLQKLLFIIGLFGLGSIKIPNIELGSLLYVIPFVALAYDIYIFAENYKVKRIGKFLLDRCSETICKEETDWEIWVGQHREPLAAFASFILTLAVLFASAVSIFFKISDHTALYIWLPLTVIATLAIFYYAKILQIELDKKK